MRVLFVGNDLDTPTTRAAAKRAGVEARFLSSRAAAHAPEKLLDADAAFVARDHGDHDRFDAAGRFAGIPFVAALGVENIAAGFANLSAEDNALCNQYFVYGGEENLFYLLCLAQSRLFGAPLPPEPKRIPFDSIYAFNGQFYAAPEEYLAQEERGYRAYVGMLCYRSRYLSGDLEVERNIKESFNRRGIGVIPAFTAGSAGDAGALSMEQAVRRFFYLNGKPAIEALVNTVLFGQSDGSGASMFERAAELYAEMGVPVIRPAESSHLTEAEWRKADAPFSHDAAFAFDIPEMSGMIEPIFTGGAEDRRLHRPIAERVERLTGRAAAWIALRRKPNAEKKLCIVLNNAVCSGVEATLGRAAGLDAFESAAALLKRLAAEGYAVGGVPEDGHALRAMFLERKAYSDFRWTSVEDIAASGGALYHMPQEEYAALYSRLSDDARARVEAQWGTPPGEAMTLDGKLVITGLRFGSVLLMIQPKRGCYGAKCTGEVCKILQDPACPPTHQFLATYWYMRAVFGADACLHLGTHGSLEFLPGKANGLSGDCFPDAALCDMPNLYVYNAASIPSALIAKRRSYAVIIDHAPEAEALHILGENELASAVGALNGAYVPPGSGGSAADMPFETGKNMYGIEIGRIPTQEAYARGSSAAEALIERFLADEGRYPEQIALNMISLDVPRTGGEQMSQMLRLLGVRPVWDERGVVTGLAPIPLAELGRPRMDVSVRISSILRDTWPDVLYRLDDAVTLVAALDEPPEENYVAKHTGEAMREGGGADIARIFGGAPGTYANSLGLALAASAWKSEEDLARYFVDSSSYVYGRNKHGEKRVGDFLNAVKLTDATCGITSLRHTDALNSSYSSRIQGGYALAAQSLLGREKPVRAYMGESAAEGMRVKPLGEHLHDGLMATLLNGDWKRRMMARGYDGAAEIMCRIENVFDMQCMGGSFSDEALNELARSYACDAETLRWFAENNPYAGEEGARRLLELNDRGKWNAAGDVLHALRRAYLAHEANLEDGLCGRGDVQGGSVDIVTDAAVAQWHARLEAAGEEIRLWKKQNS